jgi:hypothetical protein
MSKVLKIFRFTIIIFFSVCTFCTSVFGQRIEIGATVGVANYVGDLAPSMVIAETKPAFGVFGRYTISSSFAFTGAINLTQLSGSDQNFDFNKPRNISFRSNITEYSGVFEFNYFKYGYGVLDKKITSYLFLGLALFHYNPQAFYDGKWVDLRPLQTENSSYGPYSVAIPFGMGVKWRVSKHIAFESSFGFRKTYTDRIDDVSGVYSTVNLAPDRQGTIASILTDPSSELNNGNPQFLGGHKRGNADFNDWYVMANVSITYRIFSRQKCARFY